MEFEPLMSLLKISRSVNQSSYKNFGGKQEFFYEHNKLSKFSQ